MRLALEPPGMEKIVLPYFVRPLCALIFYKKINANSITCNFISYLHSLYSLLYSLYSPPSTMICCHMTTPHWVVI